ncbi:hypothetical protein ACFW9M_19145 [Streptomyces lydicus]|uniref:hypothetical protein n=1 Tax=Streptomyces lydicus TaxID=47763 RepID=UPI0036B983C9
MAKSGAIWGDIWIDVNFAPFPEEGWNDMAVAFMAELLEATYSLQRSKNENRRVHFFDGPFWVDLNMESAGKVSVTTGGGHQNLSSTIEPDQMVLDLKTSAKKIVGVCNQHGWADQGDVRRLASLCELAG